MAIKSISITGYTQSTLSISSTEATVTIADTADYTIWTTTDCYIKIGSASDSAVTTATGWILYSGSMPPPITITAGSVLRAITSSASGTLSYHKVGVIR